MAQSIKCSVFRNGQQELGVTHVEVDDNAGAGIRSGAFSTLSPVATPNRDRWEIQAEGHERVLVEFVKNTPGRRGNIVEFKSALDKWK